MKLSIIIPVYNGEKFIEKCYASLMNQDLSSITHEILFIDNKSKDNSVLIIKSLISKNPQIKLFSQPLQGEAQARNMGIKKAMGDYLYQLDIDDEVFPKALNRLIVVLDEFPEVDAVFGKMFKSNKDLSSINELLIETHEVKIFPKPYWGLEWFSNLGKVVGESAFMHRKENFVKVGLYNTDLKIGTDTALDIKLGIVCDIAFIDMYVYLYYKHADSTIEKNKKKTPRAFMIWPRLVKEHVPFYKKHPTPLKFKNLLFSQLFQSMGRQLVFTKGLYKRNLLKKELINDLKGLRIPLAIRIYLLILVILPLDSLRKIYGYYIVPYTIKKLIK